MPDIPFRGLFPPNGQRYELFECSVLVIALSLCWYVIVGPSEVTSRALYDFLDIRSAQRWGVGLILFSLFGVFASYSRRLLRAGYVVMVAVLSFWALLLLGGALAGGSIRTAGVAIIFGWIVRRLVHESTDHA